jgi:hypothetical protein
VRSKSSVDNDPRLAADQIDKGAALVPPLSISPGKALLRLISLNTRQQLFLQPGAALLKLLNLRLAINFRLAALKELDDVAVLVTKRVEALVGRD